MPDFSCKECSFICSVLSLSGVGNTIRPGNTLANAHNVHLKYGWPFQKAKLDTQARPHGVMADIARSIMELIF